MYGTINPALEFIDIEPEVVKEEVPEIRYLTEA